MAKLAASEASTFIAHQVRVIRDPGQIGSYAGQIEGQSIAVWAGISLAVGGCVVTMSWSRSMPALLITSSFVA